MRRPLTHIEPALPVEAYRTYQVARGPDLALVAACADVGCEAWRHGWETVVDESTDLGRMQAVYIRTRAGRTFTEGRREGGLTVFRFESGQRCFAEHRTRPLLLRVRRGDWRGDLGLIRAHSRAADWVEDFAEHQARLAEQIEKG